MTHHILILQENVLPFKCTLSNAYLLMKNFLDYIMKISGQYLEHFYLLRLLMLSISWVNGYRRGT